MSPEPRTLAIEAADGHRFEATVLGAEVSEGSDPRPVFLVLPAMGVRSSFYRRLGATFVRRGCHAVLADQRGHGSSSLRASWRTDFGYRHLVELDLPAALRVVRAEFPDSPIYTVGHSLGGQMSCLLAAGLAGGAIEAPAPSGLVLVASCSVYHGTWPSPGRHVFRLGLHTSRLASRLLGHFPGYLLRFAHREARGVIRDWSHQGLSGRYRLSGSDADYESLLAKAELPILAFSFADDGLSPAPAVDHLLAKLESSPKLHQNLDPAELGLEELGHFPWARRSEPVVERILEWVGEQE